MFERRVDDCHCFSPLIRARFPSHSSSSFPSQENEHYLGTDKLGSGSFGTVFRGEPKNSDAQCPSVAIKVVTVDKRNIESYKRQASALRSEAKNLKKCSDCPFVVGLVEAFVHSESETCAQVWIVMEFCENGDLSNIIKTFMSVGRTMPEPCIRRVVSSIVPALTFLHSKNIIHGDVKAENILLDRRGRVKLGDFGESKKLPPNGKRLTRVGSPFWMAPEVIEKRPHDTKIDIWSLGATVIEAATGEPPYYYLQHLSVSRIFSLILTKNAPTLFDPDLWSDDIVNFVQTCCQKDADERPTAVKLSCHDFVRQEIHKLEFLYSKMEGGFYESHLVDQMRYLRCIEKENVGRQYLVRF